MLRNTAAVALALAAALPAAAQDLVQSGSQWFTDAQAVIEARKAATPITGKAKNVILFVADGNGVGTNYAIRVFDGQQKGMLGEENVLPYEAFPNVALVKTYNINAQTPDSAPTAGALNTGVKQRFNLINLGENAITKDCSTEAANKLTTFAEISEGMGKSVGIVSTARLTHATPAAVYAKTAYRNWEAEAPEGCTDIAAQMIEAMKSGLLDVALGGGRRNFHGEEQLDGDGKGGKRKDGVDLIAAAQEAGAQYAWNTETAQALKLDGSAPILGLFGASHMKYEHDRPEDEVGLVDMTRMAIEALSTNENGYYLEIEAGRVDHANHDGNLYRTLTDGVAFAQAVALADELTDDQDTLIIVTADHEHAIAFNGYCGRGTPIQGLCYDVDNEGVKHSDELVTADDGKPYPVVGYLNGPGSVLKKQEDGSYSGERAALTQEQATDPDFLQQALLPKSSETHSGEDVIAFAKGPWAHLLGGVIEQNVIFHVMLAASTAE
ncbi:alkaline phosphatase [Albimonas sp. CAU 1670]|uniref:alkaline phosphatase n=1 Tax=Albimonas sp. CAU 1670 TaxID=3032599 RepID=UPI0023DC0090|nr:alkaline phosphatase [Albimonas sp. CAU 1670]MDF2232907.1 alkaline phosphatase [Albimonas sp. CAU 1670]